MKISEIIEVLNSIKNEHGDLNVLVNDRNYDDSSTALEVINSIKVESVPDDGLWAHDENGSFGQLMPKSDSSHYVSIELPCIWKELM